MSTVIPRPAPLQDIEMDDGTSEELTPLVEQSAAGQAAAAADSDEEEDADGDVQMADVGVEGEGGIAVAGGE